MNKLVGDGSIFSAAEFQELNKNAKRGKSKKGEEKIQLQVCEYLRVKYPDVIWMCDLASGLKLPIWIAAMHKKMRSSRGLPDLLIAKPKYNVADLGGTTTFYHGLFIELKREDVRLKSGGLASSPHIKEQLAICDKLNGLGYKAVVCCGLEEAIKVIDEYLGC